MIVAKWLKMKVRHGLGRAVQASGNTSLARRFFAKVIKARPNNPFPQLRLAELDIRDGDIDAAIMRLHTATYIDPRLGYAHDQLSRLYLRQEDREKAAFHAWKALCLTPDLEKPHLQEILEGHDEYWDLLSLHRKLRSFLGKSTQTYGGSQFYQGYRALLLPGQRPVEERLSSYNILPLLRPTFDVVDIGCNCGFLALVIAPHVNSVTGVEIDSEMVKIAEKTQRYLGLTNCHFENGKFEEFHANAIKSGRRFDVVVATAIHMHVAFSIHEFGAAIGQMMQPGGYVLLESQDLRTVDWNFDRKIAQFCDAGFQAVSRGHSSDENDVPRNHVILKIDA